MFRAHVLIVRRAKLYYTISGIIKLINGRPVHGTAIYRFDDTRDCIIQFCPPDDEHMCSKHVEAWNKLIIKLSASSLLILINKLFCCIRFRFVRHYIHISGLGFIMKGQPPLFKLYKFSLKKIYSMFSVRVSWLIFREMIYDSWNQAKLKLYSVVKPQIIQRQREWRK